MINEEAIKNYLIKHFSDVVSVYIRKLGSGVQGSGFLVELKTSGGVKSYVVKSLIPDGFGHDYPSDRASVFLLDLDEFNKLPKHVRAVDVLAEMEDGSVKSIGGGKEYYLLMERGEGRDYFRDLEEFSLWNELDDPGIRKIEAIASYLADIHSVKKDSKPLYWRKLRDTVGHGECLMGILDIYPDGVLPSVEMAAIVKKAVEWSYKLKPKFRRLSQIHGDFHPGNIWFKPRDKEMRPFIGEDVEKRNPSGQVPPKTSISGVDFILLDRSRGPWGEPADDITALTINYIFFSIKYYGMVKGPYLQALTLFFENYIRRSGDEEILSLVQLFYAFRGVVVANPLFYPDMTSSRRKMIFRFINNVLDSERFEPEQVNRYLE